MEIELIGAITLAVGAFFLIPIFPLLGINIDIYTYAPNADWAYLILPWVLIPLGLATLVVGTCAKRKPGQGFWGMKHDAGEEK